MPQPNDLSRSSQSSLSGWRRCIAVVEMSPVGAGSVAGIVPGMERHPLKKLVADEEALLRLAAAVARAEGGEGRPRYRAYRRRL